MALCVIPRRRFGQARKFPILGFSEKASRSNYRDIWPLLFSIPVLMLFATLFNYEDIKKKYGWMPIEYLKKRLNMISFEGNKEEDTAIYEVRKTLYDRY